MILKDYKIEGDYIKVSKKELEQLRDHYNAVASEKGKGKIGWFYLGKREVLIDMLKMFEPLMG